MQRLLTKIEVAALLGIHPESVMRLCREGRFPSPIKINPGARGRVRFAEADVVRWVEQRKAGSEGNEHV
jgi:excisionase family DNA binding protein